MEDEREQNAVERARGKGKLLGVPDHPLDGAILRRREPSCERDEPLAAVATSDSRRRHTCDRASEPSRAAADVENVRVRLDLSGLDEKRHPEGQVLVREALIEMRCGKAIGAERDPVVRSGDPSRPKHGTVEILVVDHDRRTRLGAAFGDVEALAVDVALVRLRTWIGVTVSRASLSPARNRDEKRPSSQIEESQKTISSSRWRKMPSRTRIAPGVACSTTGATGLSLRTSYTWLT